MSFCTYTDKDNIGKQGTSGYVVPQYSTTTGFDYTVDWSNFMFNLIPSMYRPYFDGTIWKRLRLFKYIQVIISQLQLLYDSIFLAFRYDQLYLSNVNATTIVLEKYLRDKYSDCGIYITNNYQQADLTYLFNRNEIQQNINNYIYNPSETPLPEQIYLYGRQELTPNTDFTVYVPAYIIDSGIATEQFLRALIQQYIYMTISFNIQKI
jgi:hypothetical protein